MRSTRLLATALSAICLSICDQSSRVTTEPDENIEAALAKFSPTISASRNDVTFLNGRGYLRIPDGWRQTADSEFELEIEAVDKHRWARCHLMNVGAPAPVPVSGDTVQRFITAFWSSTIEEIESDDPTVTITYPEIDNNLIAKAICFTSGDADLIMYAIFVIVDRAMIHGAHISCETASPATEQGRTDIDVFANSFRYSAK